MKILSLQLLNFRGIKELSVDFTERTTAFVGINGVGKSTVLDALAIALSQLTWRLVGHPQKARPIALDDIRHGEDFAHIAVTVELQRKPVSWSIVTNRRKDRSADPLRKSDLEALNTATALLAEEWHTFEKKDRAYAHPLPLAVYYHVNRAVLDIPVQARERVWGPVYEVYQDALSRGGADFKRFFMWFRNKEDAENEQRADSPAHRDPHLEAVRAAIEAFTEFRDLRIRRKPLLRMTVVKHGLELNVAQLSDGERNMLALVGDLAHRLGLLNPMGANPNDGHGVVLIDEIDLHLHPGWQRTVVASLERTFPNCQFIITTHSPQVIGELAAESVMLLRDCMLLGHAERALGTSVGRHLSRSAHRVWTQRATLAAIARRCDGYRHRVRLRWSADGVGLARWRADPGA
jgi:predicted ATP-binding protein involved in virulence